MKGKYIRILAALMGFFALIAFDQLTKYLVKIHLKANNDVVIIKNVFVLQYLENRGAAFGMLQNQLIFFAVMTLLIIGLIVFVLYRIHKIKTDSTIQPNVGKRYFWLQLILVFLTAGAIGNLIDRIRLNYVIDFLYFKLIDFPIFNVADCYVTLSASALILFGLFYYKEEDINRLFPPRKQIKKSKEDVK